MTDHSRSSNHSPQISDTPKPEPEIVVSSQIDEVRCSIQNNMTVIGVISPKIRKFIDRALAFSNNLEGNELLGFLRDVLIYTDYIIRLTPKTRELLSDYFDGKYNDSKIIGAYSELLEEVFQLGFKKGIKIN